MIPNPKKPDHEEDPVPMPAVEGEEYENEEDEKWFIDREVIVGNDGEEFPG